MTAIMKNLVHMHNKLLHTSRVSKFSNLIICLCMLCTAQTIYARSSKTYLGIDLMQTYFAAQPGYGKDLFGRKPVTQLNFFAGHYLTQHFGFEFAYQQSLHALNEVYVPAATSEFGIANFTGIASNVYLAQKYLHSWSMQVVPQIKIFNSFSLIPVIGATYMRVKGRLQLIEFDGASAIALEQSDYQLNFSANKIVPKLGVMVQQTFYKRFAIRLSYLWQQTAKLSMQTTRAILPSQTLLAKWHNSSTWGIGVLYILGQK